MCSAIFVRFGILIGLVTWSSSVPCAVDPREGCSSCTNWLDVEVGEVYCKMRNIPGHLNSQQLSCKRMKQNSRICMDEKFGWSQCAKTSQTKVTETIDVLKKLNMTRREFQELNRGINLESEISSVVRSYCVEGYYPANCTYMYLPTGTETCKDLDKRFDISPTEFMRLNPLINCAKRSPLKPGEPVCVEDSMCSYWHTATPQDTCAKLSKAFKISSDMLSLLNPSLRCPQPEVGKSVCVWPNSNRPIPNAECNRNYKVKWNDTCLAITILNGLTIDELRFLNPSLVCEDLPFGKDVCVQAVFREKCSRIENVPPNTTCQQLFTEFSASSPEIFFMNNPLVQCDKLQETQQICGGIGFFEADKCEGYLTIQAKSIELEKFLEREPFKNDTVMFEMLNPTFREGDLTRGTVICTEKKNDGRMYKLKTIASAVSQRSALLMNALFHYETSPSWKTQEELRNTFVKEIKNPFVYMLLKYLQTTNSTVKEALSIPDEEEKRAVLCDQYKSKNVGEELRNCFCEKEELYIYCEAVLLEELASTQQKVANNNRLSTRNSAQREKRGFGCNLDIAGFKFSVSPGSNKKDSSTKQPSEKTSPKKTITDSLKIVDFSGASKKILKAVTQEFCAEGDCTIPLPGVINLVIGGGLCFNVLDKVTSLARDLFNPNERDWDQFTSILGMINDEADEHFSIKVEICFTLPEILEKIGFDVCIAKLKVSFHLVQQVIRIDAFLNSGTFSVKYDGVVKVTEVSPPWDSNTDEIYDQSICSRDRFRCDDYCIWRRNGMEGVQHYGVISVKLTIAFFLKAEVFGHTWPKPETNDCYDGSAPIIVIENRRKTCDSSISVECRRKFDRPPGTNWGTSKIALNQLITAIDTDNPVKAVQALWKFAKNVSKVDWSNLGVEKEDPWISYNRKVLYSRQHTFKIGNEEGQNIYTCTIRSGNGGKPVVLDVFRGAGPRSRLVHKFVLQDDNKVIYEKNGKNIEKGTLIAERCDNDHTGHPELSEPVNKSMLPCAQCDKRAVLYTARTMLQPRLIKAYTHYIFYSFKLHWNSARQKVDYDPEAIEARQIIRNASGETWLMFTVEVDQPIFRNNDLFRKDIRSYILKIAELIPVLKIDGIDVLKTGAQDVTEQDMTRVAIFVKYLRICLLAVKQATGRVSNYVISLSDNSKKHPLSIHFGQMLMYINFFTLGPDTAGDWTDQSQLTPYQPGMSMGNLFTLADFLVWISELRCKLPPNKLTLFYISDGLHYMASCIAFEKDREKALSKCYATYTMDFFSHEEKIVKEDPPPPPTGGPFGFLVDAFKKVVHEVKTFIVKVYTSTKNLIENFVGCIFEREAVNYMEIPEDKDNYIGWFEEAAKAIGKCLFHDRNTRKVYNYPDYTRLIKEYNCVEKYNLGGIAFRSPETRIGFLSEKYEVYVSQMKNWDSCRATLSEIGCEESRIDYWQLIKDGEFFLGMPDPITTTPLPIDDDDDNSTLANFTISTRDPFSHRSIVTTKGTKAPPGPATVAVTLGRTKGPKKPKY